LGVRVACYILLADALIQFIVKSMYPFVIAFEHGSDAALFLKAELLSGLAENLDATSLSSTIVSILLADASTLVVVPFHIPLACFNDALRVFG